jgi:uncharacterized membrane protein YccC
MLGLLAASLVLLVSGLVATGAEPQPAPPAPTLPQMGKMLRHGLLWTVVIFFILVVALLALRRFSFRYKQQLKPKSKRTEPSDLWQQYRLPPDWDDDHDITVDPLDPDEQS